MPDRKPHPPHLYIGVTLIVAGGLVGAFVGNHWLGVAFAVAGFAALFWEGIVGTIRDLTGRN